MSSAYQSSNSVCSPNCESADLARHFQLQVNSAIPWITKRFIGIATIAGLVALIVVPVMETHGSDRVTLYIATCGNDAWSGKLVQPNAEKSDGPFATIERARDEIRRMKTGGKLPKEGVAVEILGGRYELTKPVELTAEDSGTAESPIIYRARPGDVVRISGGRLVAGWKPVTDTNVLSRLDPSARGKVYETDLQAQGIGEYGDLGLDAAWKLQTRLATRHFQGEYTMGSAQASVGKGVHPRMEVFFDDEPMQISRGPNDGEITIEEALGETVRDVRGHKSRVEGIFLYKGDYPRRWLGEKNAWVCGSWCRDWAEQRHRIKSFDAEKRVISVHPPYHYYGYREGYWFYGFNILAELDRPGEWYADQETGKLYFWPPKLIAKARVEVSMSPGLFALSGASHVAIRGVLMEATRGTAVTIDNGRHCRVVGCTFRNLGNHAVTIYEGKENGVVGCDMYGIGGGGVYLVGGDRKTLMPAGHFAENNHIHHFARWDRMYRPGVMISGVGNRVSHNLIHDAPHSAIVFGGNDHVIEYNEIHNVCFESHDCGAIYAGRSWTLRGHRIRYNYRRHPGAVGIPLFSYLYHEYAIGYGGDSAVLHPSSDRRMLRAHAVNLVTGRTPGGSIWSSQQNMYNAHTDQITMLRNHCRLLKTRAREFLLLGRMLHPYELDVPKLTFRWTVGAGENAKTETTEDPAILTSSWQSPSGKVGHLFVNISDKPQPMTVQLDTRNAPGWPECDVAFCSSEEGSTLRSLWKHTSLPREFSRELQPLEGLFLEVCQSISGPETREAETQ